MYTSDPDGNYSDREVADALRGVDGVRDLEPRYERYTADLEYIEDIDYITDGKVKNNALADIKRTFSGTLMDEGNFNFLSDKLKCKMRMNMPADIDYETYLTNALPSLRWKLDDPQGPSGSELEYDIVDPSLHASYSTAVPLTFGQAVQADSDSASDTTPSPTEFWVTFTIDTNDPARGDVIFNVPNVTDYSLVYVELYKISNSGDLNLVNRTSSVYQRSEDSSGNLLFDEAAADPLAGPLLYSVYPEQGDYALKFVLPTWAFVQSPYDPSAYSGSLFTFSLVHPTRFADTTGRYAGIVDYRDSPANHQPGLIDDAGYSATLKSAGQNEFIMTSYPGTPMPFTGKLSFSGWFSGAHNNIAPDGTQLGTTGEYAEYDTRIYYGLRQNYSDGGSNLVDFDINLAYYPYYNKWSFDWSFYMDYDGEQYKYYFSSLDDTPTLFSAPLLDQNASTHVEFSIDLFKGEGTAYLNGVPHVAQQAYVPPAGATIQDAVAEGYSFTGIQVDAFYNYGPSSAPIAGVTGDDIAFWYDTALTGSQAAKITNLGRNNVSVRRGYVEWPLGVFMLPSNGRTYKSDQYVSRDVEGYDQTKILADDCVDDRYVVLANAKYTDAIKALVVSAGIKQYQIINSSLRLAADMEWEPGTSKLAVINDLISGVNYGSINFDENGIFTVGPYKSPTDRASEWEYITNEESVISGDVDQTVDLFDIPNKWVLVASEAEIDYPLRAVYVNNNPLSPTSTVARGRTIVDYRDNQIAADQPTIDGLAKRAAVEASQVYETVEFETATMPIHSNADVYTLGVDGLGVSNVYAETEWELDMNPGGKMSHSVRRIVQL